MNAPGPSTKPAPIVPLGAPPAVRYCKECGHPFHPRREDQEFCCPAHRNRFHKRRYERGAKIYDLAIAWRTTRAPETFSELCRAIDEWTPDERKRTEQRAAIRAEHRRQQGLQP